jgi:lantibiotic modifying enzyme
MPDLRCLGDHELEVVTLDHYLTMAAQIGWRISREAVWHGDRCNWMGAEPIERPAEASHTALTYRSLGVDLYGGTSGVALFLSELHAVTGEDSARKAACGALRHALSRPEVVPPSARLGLFAGWMGIALVAARIARVLNQPEWMDRAVDLVRRLTLEPIETNEFDVMAGRAGATAALVVMHEMTGEKMFLDLAVRLGDELLASAEKTDIGYSWVSPGLRNQKNLTGFSHGTAGAACSMLELFTATGNAEYRDAAKRAFDYERHWFNPEMGNWPDFRADPFYSGGGKRPLAYANFWCHGAPGIALSRLRAWEILRDGQCRDEAVAALRTTRENVAFALHSRSVNYSLCHGLTGNAEALSYGRMVLDGEDLDCARLCRSVADSGIAQFAGSDREWPCGTHTGETPNLMLGLAGIGHFYLRVAHAATPSVLVLRSGRF